MKEGNDLTRAIDLKSKVSGLIMACSEVSNYLTVMMADIQRLNSLKSDSVSFTEKMEKEKDNMARALSDMKSSFEKEKISIESWKHSQLEEVNKQKSEAKKIVDEANETLRSAKKKDIEVEEKIEKFDKQRRELEDKFSRVKELVG